MGLRARFRALARSQAASRILRTIYGGQGTILCLHRVIPAHLFSVFNRAIELTPGDLDAIIGWAKGEGFSFISLAEFCCNVQNQRGRKMLCLTFDDGYADNIDYALPVLKAHDSPATIFVATDRPDQKLKMWWFAFEEMLRGTDNAEKTFAALVARAYANNPAANDTL